MVYESLDTPTHGYIWLCGNCVSDYDRKYLSPIPSEAILTFAGFLTTYTTLHIPGAILSATFGSLLGAIFLYALGKLLSPSKMDSLISGPVGKALRLKKEDIQKAMPGSTAKETIRSSSAASFPLSEA